MDLSPRPPLASNPKTKKKILLSISRANHITRNNNFDMGMKPICRASLFWRHCNDVTGPIYMKMNAYQWLYLACSWSIYPLIHPSSHLPTYLTVGLSV